MLQPDDVRNWSIGYLAEHLDMDRGEIDPDRTITDYGLDSLQASIMAGVMEEEFDVELEPITFLRASTINEIVSELQAEGIVSNS